MLLNGGGAPSARCFPSEKDLLLELRAPHPGPGSRHPDGLEHRGLRRAGAAPAVRRPRRPVRHRPLRQPGHVPRPRGRRGGRALAAQPGHRRRRGRSMDALWLVRLSGMGLEDYRLRDRGARPARPGQADRPPTRARAASRRSSACTATDPEALCTYCLGDARLVLDILASEGLPGHRAAQVAADRHHPRPDRGSAWPRSSTSTSSTSTAAAWWPPPSASTRTRWNVARAAGSSPRGPGCPTTCSPSTSAACTRRSSGRSTSIRCRGCTRSAASAAAPRPAGLITAPNGARLRREPGILPGILERFFVERAAAKRRGDERSSYAYKIVMNSFYGVLGTEGCRFAAPEPRRRHHLLRPARAVLGP
ncbi:MAG: hypothetical protein MZV70_37385 [Desulfobacterales bacterium]|nr:hypothetical protein [Desulfobacterales bacterium]